MLISLCAKGVYAQSQARPDTLQKPSLDSLNTQEDSEETLEEQVSYTAEDSIVAMPAERKAFLYGKAKVSYGAMNIEAEIIELDYKKNMVTAYGKKDSLGKNIGTPVFKDGEQTMEADKIMYNLKTKRGKIFNALTHQGELLVIGAEIKKDSTDIVYMKGMECIPCKEADARTRFKATKAKIIPNDKIVTGPMYLEIGGAPTPFGLPFGYFPNTKSRHNGILIPTYANHNVYGYGLTNGGFYWGINDKADMVIRGDIYENGTWRLSTQNNYYVLYKATGSLALDYRQFNLGDKDIPSSFQKQIAYSIFWQHAQDNKNNPSVAFRSSVNFAKNQTFSRTTATSSGQFLQNTYQSNINYTKIYKFGSLSLNGSHSQNTITRDMNITLPSLTFNANRFFPFKRENAAKPNALDKLGVTYIMNAQNTLSGKDSTIFKGNLLDSMNYGIKHGSTISTNFTVLKYITVTPAVNLSAQMYAKTIRKEFYVDTVKKKTAADRDTTVLLQKIRDKWVSDPAMGYSGAFSTAFNTQIYFDYVFRKGKVKQIRHLLIPTVSYNYNPDFGSAQYGFWKKVQKDTLGGYQNYSIFGRSIYGGPANGKVNGLSFNLNNTLDAKMKQKTDTGMTYKKVSLLQNVGLSGSYNFAADSFKMSNITLTARTVLFKNINVTYNSSFNPYVYRKSTDGNSPGREINKFVAGNENRLARLTNANIAVNSSIGSNMLEAAKKVKQALNMTNGAESGGKDDLSPDEKLPWNLGVTYNLNLSNPDDRRLQATHYINISGDVMPTKYWKTGITSGFDFKTQKLTYTRFTISRDLKCWQASISWVPFGLNKSYSISLNMKTSMLSDLKIPYNKQYLDKIQ